MLITRNNRTVTASSPKFVYSDSLRIILVNPLATSVCERKVNQVNWDLADLPPDKITWFKQFKVQGFRLESPKGCIPRGFRIRTPAKLLHPMSEKGQSGCRVET